MELEQRCSWIYDFGFSIYERWVVPERASTGFGGEAGLALPRKRRRALTQKLEAGQRVLKAILPELGTETTGRS